MLTCKTCSSPIPSRNIYCDNKCQADYEYQSFIAKWLSGIVVGWRGKTRQLSNHVRRYLHETRGTGCECCGWDVKHPVDGATLTEIDHIDGDPENCTPENLRILCPNCHAMTPTFRARNKASSRERFRP